jgi:diaminopimelate epimerase
VIQVPELDSSEFLELGPKLESHPIFPDRANISFVEVVHRKKAKLWVYERGAGATLACGTGACATFAALRSMDLIDSKVAIQLPGGSLEIRSDRKGALQMTGPAEFVFEGRIRIEKLPAIQKHPALA